MGIYSADGGDSWSAGGYGAGWNATICRDDRTKAIAWAGLNLEWTDDSGSTWNADSTPAPNIAGTANDIDFNFAARAYQAGDTAGTTGLWYSVNGGDDWSQCAGGYGSFNAVCMHDATHGLAIDDQNNIFFTANGTSWTDTTHQHTGTSDKYYAIHITASGAAKEDFVAYIVDRTEGTTGRIYYYDGSGNDATINAFALSGTNPTASDFYTATNGDAFIAMSSSNESNEAINLFRLPSGETNFQTRSIISTGMKITSYGDAIVEYDTDEMLVADTGMNIFKFYVSA